MSESAIITHRELKMQQTAAGLTTVARRLTAERGLSGFTIEEVCAEVDISRRTFFNYFPSKEDAILGVDSDEESRLFAEQFLARGSHGWPRVLDDLVELVIAQFDAAGADAVGHGDLIAAIEREPRLLVRLMGLTRERERNAIALIAQREGTAVDDLRNEAVVAILSTLIRSSSDRLLAPDNNRTFSELITERLATLRDVL